VKLGILVNSDRHLETITGMTRAALAKGHEVLLFAMDDGTRLLANPGYIALCQLAGVNMSFCQESATRKSVNFDALPEAIAAGSQLQNAMMVQKTDRIIVL
jgi:predicted peroxiredoxin